MRCSPFGDQHQEIAGLAFAQAHPFADQPAVGLAGRAEDTRYAEIAALLLVFGAQASHLPAMDEHFCNAVVSGRRRDVQRLLAGGWNKDAKCSAGLLCQVDSGSFGGFGQLEAAAAPPRNPRAGAFGLPPPESPVTVEDDDMIIFSKLCRLTQYHNLI